MLLLVVAVPVYARVGHRHSYNPVPIPIPVPAQNGLQLGAFNAKVGTVAVSFLGWQDQPSCVQGKTNFLYWENYGVSLDSIINGSQDQLIRGLKPCPDTILALFHEMNGNWDPWDGTVGSNTPTKVVQAYQHVHNLLGNIVRYAWVINNSDVPNVAGNRPMDYYPGDAYVDIIGIDGFSWSGGSSFEQAISPNFQEIRKLGLVKPMWVTSFGTANNSSQGAWLNEALNYARNNNIQGLLYFSYKDGTDFTLNNNSLTIFK